jgi:ribosomal protein S18 acetylase RimI-like enzyme
MRAMKIRPASVEDAAALAAVHIDTWRNAYRGQMPQDYLDELDATKRVANWRQWIESDQAPAGTLVLDDETDGVAGFIYVSRSRDLDTDPEMVGEVQAVYVRSGYWGQGAGRRLMEAGLSRLAEAGLRESILWVLNTNRRARRFYEAGGWQPDGASKTDDLRGFPLVEVRYRRPL